MPTLRLRDKSFLIGVLWVLILTGLDPSYTAAVEPTVEAWTDRRLPVTAGLSAWYDATTLAAALAAQRVEVVAPGQRIRLWPDGSGHRRDARQDRPETQPLRHTDAAVPMIEFPGDGPYLQASRTGAQAESLTLYLVTAPYSNAENFAGLISLSEPARNDFETGLNIDQGVGTPARLQVINVEGAGNPGMRNLLTKPVDFGTVLRLCVISEPGPGGTRIRIDGADQGARDRATGSTVHMDELVLGARRYTLGGRPEIRGFARGAIAEVLLYNRKLTPQELMAVDAYLAAKYANLAPLPVPGLAVAGKPLERVKSPPDIQVLLPGFSVRPLPVALKNINNVLYRPDGALLALGYDGIVWRLTDSDGDGLEDQAAIYWDSRGQIRAPIGMDLTRPGKSPRGVVVASKGKCSLLVESSDGTHAERELVIADGWKESPHGVDALGVAVDPRDGSVYFGLGTQDFTNAYVLDKDGTAAYSLSSERGTILRVAPDFQSREIIATGIRFPVGLRFNRHGDLFCTDQEGATWLPNGNPFDELLHIEKGRHYGFPPRHPRHLPNVIDEPSTFDYGPQHQSTCGLAFNEPVTAGGPTFGPADWASDVFVTGYSRGKLYRTQLHQTQHGYLARNSLFACLSHLTADCCVAPDGSLLVACHSGGPDWGSGPTGAGQLFKITRDQPDLPLPVLAWPTGDRELRIEFDRPVDPTLLRDLRSRTDITAGPFVRAGDRFESLWPGYAVVQSQQRTSRRDIRVHSVQLTPDHRSLILATDSLRQAQTYALQLPGLGRPDAAAIAAPARPQVPEIDLDFDLTGVDARWTSTDGAWTGWLPCLDLAAARQWTRGSAPHESLWQATQSRGTLTLTARLNLNDLLRPEVQPGSRIDYAWPDEDVTLTFHAPVPPKVRVLEGPQPTEPVSRTWTLKPGRDARIVLEIQLEDVTTAQLDQFGVSYSTQEDPRPRPLPLRRVLRPWSTAETATESIAPTRPKELEGGRWAAGWKLFHHPQTGCARCHAVLGQGARIGPDLSNLVHRDYHSVLRDIQQPSFAINPDFVGSVLTLRDGRVLTGVVRTEQGRLQVGDKEGKLIVVDPTDVEEIHASPVSIMPDGLLKPFTPEQTRDLLTYLLTAGPSMPRDDPGVKRPPPRRLAEVLPLLEGANRDPETLSRRPLRICLVAGPKDHGPGEHDYPAWLRVWNELLSLAENVTVVTAMNWPEAAEFDRADLMVFYQRGDWTADRARQIDGFLKNGKGLVYIHWAVDGQQDSPGFARRIALAWGAGSRFRHGPLDLTFQDHAHPITRGFRTLKLVDESYWNLTGLLPDDRILATGIEENRPQPLFWSLEHNRGRVFVSIPGHYSWTFDDPLYRLLLLRAMAWTAHEPVDRFNALIWPGADVVP